MHLANAFGVPVIALFGTTSPQFGGPVFEAPRSLLEPQEKNSSVPSMAEIHPDQVLSCLGAYSPL